MSLPPPMATITWIIALSSWNPIRNRAFSIMNIHLPSSRDNDLDHVPHNHDNIDSSFWFPIFSPNLVQFSQLWISSSPLGMSLPHSPESHGNIDSVGGLGHPISCGSNTLPSGLQCWASCHFKIIRVI
jgi:hypothetical protein